MQILTGAEIVVECLKEQGVDTVFGYPGGSILNIYDALYKHQDEITHILTSHEQGASHAADGYARATGKVGVCLATSGPGATNLVTGIATAYMDSIPMVAITCNVGVSLLGKDSFQEIDITGVTMPITKYNFIVKDITKLAGVIRRAFAIARSGRPGPVLVDITKDVTSNSYDYEYLEPEPMVRQADTIEEEDLEQVIRFESSKGDGTLFVSVQAKGSGRLWLTALHRRISRGSHGYFLPGGERYVTSRREEAFSYFEPGDLKPPLNVYFSGYKTLQGFEGYYMMKNMGCPFLLLSEPRLEGGSFYMGSEEYEQIYPNVIREYMQVLGFTQEQVIMSGLSMGTFGALYYGCDIEPYAMVVGKPLVSIGNVAANEKYLRPGGFPTSLDVLHFQCGGMGEEDVRRLNEKFWNKFDRADWRKSRFAVAYMIEDDYDADAYETLLLHLNSGGVQAYGKGLHGRHNDNTPGIVDWFVGQYKKILQEDFGRRMDR